MAAALAALPLLQLLPVDVDRALPLAFAPAVWLLWGRSRKASNLDSRLVAWAVAAMLLAAFFSDHDARSWVMTAAIGWALAGAWAANALSCSIAAVRIVLGGIAAGAVLGTAMLKLGVDADTSTFPIYGSARLYGAHQFDGAVAATILLVTSSPTVRLRLLTAVAVLLTLTGLFWSGSRAPVVGLAVFLGASFWRAIRRERRVWLQWLPALTGGALLLSLLLGSPHGGMGWSSAIQRTVAASGIEEVSSERSRFWLASWRHALASPWIGHGADGYRFIQPAQNGSQPHNVLLQWFLEYGIFGLVPLGLLLVRGLGGLFATGAANASDVHGSLRRWSAAGLTAAVAYGLLEGVFYHATILMPVAVMAGFSFPARSAPLQPSSSNAGRRVVPALLLLIASGLMLLHGWIGHRLLHARDVTPDSLTARVLRTFPSTTHGLRNWTESWRTAQPDVAMEWIRWAQSVSAESASFHVYAAQLYIWEKDYKSAERELLHCLEKVHHLERSDVQIALATVRRLGAGSGSAETPPQP